MAFVAAITATTACAIVVLGIDAVQSFAAGHGAAPFALALPLALLPVPLLVALVLWMDRLEPEPRRSLAFAFGWGAGIAALTALIVNTANLEYVTMPALGATTGQYVAATFGAPVVEETLKGAVLIVLLRRRRAEFDGPADGVIYAAMVGLGFAMIENVGYYVNALITPEHGGIELLGYTFVLRGLVSPLLHPIFTSMTGLGVAYSASRRAGAPWAVGARPAGRHGAARHLERPVPVRHRRAWSPPTSSCPACSPALVAILVADRRRVIAPHPPLPARLHRAPAWSPRTTSRCWPRCAPAAPRARWARASGGLPAAAAMSDYQLAATELALACGQADRGAARLHAFAAREHDLLTLMAVARHAFTSRLPGGSEFTPAPWARVRPPPSRPAADPGRCPYSAPVIE